MTAGGVLSAGLDAFWAGPEPAGRISGTGADAYTLTSSLLAPRSDAATVINLGNDIAPIPASERAAHGLDRPLKKR